MSINILTNKYFHLPPLILFKILHRLKTSHHDILTVVFQTTSFNSFHVFLHSKPILLYLFYLLITIIIHHLVPIVNYNRVLVVQLYLRKSVEDKFVEIFLIILLKVNCYIVIIIILIRILFLVLPLRHKSFNKIGQQTLLQRL